MLISIISSSFTQNDTVSAFFFNEFPYDIILCSELVSSFSINNKSLIFNFCIFIKVVNTVPVPAVLAGMYCTGMHTGIKTSTFRTGLNTGHTSHTDQFRAIPVGTGHTSKYREKFFFFFFLSFVIFEFLLGQNGNLFALTY